MKFKNRIDASKQLAGKLLRFTNATDTVILALPRGGVPVAYQLAITLDLPLDVFIVRKLGFPGHEEYAMGAIAANGACVFTDASGQTDIKNVQLILDKEKLELTRCNKLYRQGKPMPDLRSKTIILVDDGIATGASIRVALLALEKLQPKRIILAVPVLPADSIKEITLLVSQLIYIMAPGPEVFRGVSKWYENFPQVSDEKVMQLLSQTKKP